MSETEREKYQNEKRGAAAARIYLVEGLDCANCGAKIEAALNEMPEIDEAVLTFATKK